MNARIAVVDYDGAILDSAKLFLETHGWQVHTYATGEAFLADLGASNVPRCLILDPHLPGINGSVVAATIATSYPGIAVVVLTARPESELTRNTVAMGGHAMLTKPVTSSELISVVRGVLGES